MAPPKPANGAGNMSVTEFAMTYSLDDKCIEALSKQPLEVQQHVILQGPVEGRNPSAMVMGRLAKATSEFMAYGGSPGAGASNYPTSGYSHNHGYSHESDIQANVEEFLMANGVDDKAADSLRSQSLECQAAVLGQGPAEGRNPSAMVMGRIAKFNRGEI